MPIADKDYLLMQASYLRCCSANGFFDTFYEIFLNKSPAVAEKFAGTDFSRQKRVLKDSLFLMVADSQGTRRAQEEIERIGKTHSRQQRDIPPAMYTLWLDSLCESLKIHDPGYSAELEELWREKMGKIINQITAVY